MNQEIKELKERYNEIVQIDSADDFFRAFCEFLRYISDTPSLRKHAQKVLREKPASSMIYAVNTLYTELNRHWENDYNAEKQIWSEILKKFAGRPSEYKTPILFTGLREARSASNHFYTKLLAEIENESFSTYAKIAIMIDKSEHSIYLAKDIKACYSIKNRTKNTKAPKRFRLICVLLSQKNGVSIARLNELLDKNTDTQNLKKDVEAINNLFRRNVFNKELITIEKLSNKNMYSINRDSFHFQVLGN